MSLIARVAPAIVIAGGIALAMTPIVANAEPVAYSLERALSEGVSVHPTLAARRAATLAAQARILAITATRRPSLSLGATAGIGGSASSVPGDERSWYEPIAAYAASASASWRIYDFGQTAAGRQSSEASAAAAQAAEATAELDVRTAIASAYMNAVARKQLLTVQTDALAREQFYLEQALAFVRAGSKDPIEKAQAQSRVATARTALIRAEGELDLARARLREAIGIEDPSLQIDVVEGWPAGLAQTPESLSTFLEAAWNNRPEMAEYAEQLRAAELSHKAAKLGQAPVLSLAGNAQQPLFSQDRDTPTWQVGASLAWSIFDGGRRRANTRESAAGVASVSAGRDLLRLRISAEVESAWVAIRSGRATIDAADEAVVFAKEQLRLAEARYQQGVGSRIELSEAQSGAIVAAGQRIEAQWALALAWLALERAVGKPMITNSADAQLAPP
ncbi:MAG: TolC family protein [Myxococcales bacterium]|nr:TolC family protein [Myxococcales bacterium]